jgi:Zn-dependent peptidase ImmA (M78 family)/DNA-binding XRE family transcriptional regulator
MTSTQAGERVRTLRLLLGLTQTELASAIPFSQSLLSQVESGVKVASEEFVASVASATGTPTSFFDVDPPNVPEGTLRWRKLAGARRSDSNRLELLVQEAWRIASDLMSTANLTPPQLPVVTTHIDATDIEELATMTRDALGLGADGPIPHVTRVLERAHIGVAPLVLPESTATTEVDEAKNIGHFGASLWPTTDDQAFIGYFPAQQGDRQRFTLAHELGHLVLHTKRRQVRNAEAEAHLFAGAFLFPRERAMEAFSVPPTLSDLGHLKARWGVSMQAQIMRAAGLGLIDDHRKTSLFKQLSARGWRQKEPVDVQVEYPALLKLLARRAYGNRPVAQVARELGLPPLVLRGLMPTDSSQKAG